MRIYSFGRAFLRFALTTALPGLAFAATADTGSISGRVLNPATGEYVRNAEVAVGGLRTVSATMATIGSAAYQPGRS